MQSTWDDDVLQDPYDGHKTPRSPTHGDFGNPHFSNSPFSPVPPSRVTTPSFDTDAWAPPLPGAHATELLGLFATLGGFEEEEPEMEDFYTPSRPGTAPPGMFARPNSPGGMMTRGVSSPHPYPGYPSPSQSPQPGAGGGRFYSSARRNSSQSALPSVHPQSRAQSACSRTPGRQTVAAQLSASVSLNPPVSPAGSRQSGRFSGRDSPSQHLGSGAGSPYPRGGGGGGEGGGMMSPGSGPPTSRSGTQSARSGGGGGPLRQSFSQGLGLPKPPRFVQSASAAGGGRTPSRIGAVRVVENGQNMLILDWQDDEPKTKAENFSHVTDELKKEFALVKLKAKRKEAWVRSMKEDSLQDKKVQMRAVGPLRRQLEDKLDNLRENPHELEKLKARCVKYSEEFTQKQQHIINANREQIKEFMPGKRQQLYLEMTLAKEERIRLAKEKKMELDMEREWRYREMAMKHDKLKAAKQAERDAIKAHEEQQEWDAAVIIFSTVAARLRTMRQAMVRHRFWKKLKIMKSVCARKIQRFWRARRQRLRERKAQHLTFFVAFRWRHYVKARKRQRIVAANHLKQFFDCIASISSIAQKVNLFRSKVKTVQRVMHQNYLRFIAQTQFVQHQWHLAENELQKKRQATLEALNAVNAASGAQEGGVALLEVTKESKEKNKNNIKALMKGDDPGKEDAKPKAPKAKKKDYSKEPHILPKLKDGTDEDVSSDVTFEIARWYVRMKRRGYRTGMVIYESQKHEYDKAVMHQQLIQNAKESVGHDNEATITLASLVEPDKPSASIFASKKDLGVMMQLGVAYVLRQREIAHIVKMGNVPPEPLDIVAEMVARGIEERVQKKAPKVKSGRKPKANEVNATGDVKPTKKKPQRTNKVVM